MDFEVTEKIRRMARSIIDNNHASKYDAELHIPMLIEQFSEGRSIAAFCFGAEISQVTFHNWVDKHKDFAVAYDIARTFSQLWWEEKAKESLVTFTGESFNTTLWCMVMKNKFSYTDQRKLAIPGLKKATTFNKKMQCIIEHLSEGKLTAQESNQLSNVILTAIKVNEGSDVVKRLEVLEGAAKIE